MRLGFSLLVVLLLTVGGAIADNQVNIDRSPTTVYLQASKETAINLSIFAVDKLIAPSINNQTIVNELPSGASITIQPDDIAYFTYSDRFSRHFRGRRQYFKDGKEPEAGSEVERYEDLLGLPPNYPKPKVLLDIHRMNVESLAFDNQNDVLWWTGELVYKFDFGIPVKTFHFTSLDGRE